MEDNMEWPELLGKDCRTAEAFLRESNSALSIAVVPEGSLVTCDYRLDRVRLFVDQETKTTIVAIPRIG